MAISNRSSHQSANHSWNEADLEIRLCRALDVAKRAIQCFGSFGFNDAQSPENSFHADKPIAETAMLIYAASGARRLSSVATRVDEIAQLLAPYARSQTRRLNIALHPTQTLDFAFSHILLSKLGYCDPDFDDYLRSCFNTPIRNGRELPPVGSLEKRWIESLWNGTPPNKAWRVDLVNSVLNRPIDLLGGLRDDQYFFTHLLMYCTDFGFRTFRFPRGRTAILNEARSLLARCLDSEDYDLAGEVIMAWPLTGSRWCATSTFGFRVLTSAEDQIGVLPGGTTNVTRLNALKGNEKTAYALGTAYHTALVMGLLCATSLRPDMAPWTRISGPLFEGSVIKQIMTFVDRTRGYWQTELSKLGESELNALGPFLLDLAIIQNFRKREFEAIHKLLIIANQHRITYTPVCYQAAELLRRLSLSLA